MKFTVKIRPFSKKDLSLACPFMPSNLEYNQGLDLLLGEIGSCQECRIVSVDGDSIYMDTIFSSVCEVEDRLRPLFSEYICCVRFVEAELLE